MDRVLIAILTLTAATLAVPQSAFAALSSADAVALTNDLATLSGGWNQPAVDESNTILSRQQYSATEFTDFFGNFFSTHAMTDDLRNYLVYPTFGWFDNTVHLKLQTALSEVLWQRITALTASSVPQMATDVNVRNTLLQSHRFLNYFTTSSVLPPDGQEQLYQRYKAYVLQYPQYFGLAYPQRDWPYLGSLRVQVNVNLVDMTSLMDARKNEIATSLNLTGQKLSLWNDLTVLVIDNDGLDARQLQSLSTLYHMTPQSLFFLRFLSVFDFLRSSSDDSDRLSPIVGTTTYNNISGVRVGSASENGFPSDIEPCDTDVFLIIAAHELSHLVDFHVMSSNPALAARRADLLARAGSVDLQYLRSQYGSVFQTSPQEFFASIGNEYFANTQHTLDLALQRFRTGVGGVKYAEPLNQFLFFADVFSSGGDSTFFYAIDTAGNLSRRTVSLTRDSNGHINSLVIDGLRYAFVTDANGYVSFILAQPGACGYLIDPMGQAWPTTGGTGTVNITADVGCTWSASSTLSWVNITGGASGTGSGTVTYQVAVNAEGARSGSLTIAGLPYTVEQSGTVTGLISAGSMAQLVSGGIWNTTITLVNTGAAAAQARLNFFDNNGNPLPLPLTFPQTSSATPLLASTLDRTLNAGSALVIHIAGLDSQAALEGWGQLLTNGTISGFAVFGWKAASGDQEAVAPLETRNPGSFVLWFDNTGGYATGVALANIAAASGNIGVVVRDGDGAVLSSSSIALSGFAHTSFMLADRFATTANRSGTVEFQTPVGGQINLLAIRANPKGAITAVPPLVK
ncbi:MAG: hypothetical protein ABSD27_06220 [Bryobacteraceae bacterium]